MNQVSNVNGISDNSSEISIVDRKPIITYAGDKDLFLSLEPTLASSLPQEPTEWRRAYGRAVKSVHVAAAFVPFSKDVIPVDGDYCLIQQPVFHTYWTQCSDVDTYKMSLRDDIDAWMRTLGSYKVTDWMIVVVETYDFRKTNKLLPRTTVLDKIKNDFGTKHADRCLSVINPLKSESRSAGSWRGLMVNMRLLLLSAYDKTLLRFEEVIREQREKRNQPGWSFCKYFLLQEELAFVLEMLGIYEEALVQYDELDALFTQFVLNSNFGDIPEWLAGFQSPLQSWPGLTLKHKVNNELRILIQKNKISLLQFRSYLFSRQCSMLLFSFKPWEVAQRSLQFLHNCINELNILEVTRPPGAVACWVFLCCREVLQTCEKFNDTGQIEAYSLYTAALWAYARDKLGELGELCGLMPGGEEPSSAQLHTVVLLSAGIGDSEATHPAAPSPTDHLKQALSSTDAFCKQYLELSELAMGTYKHIGRTRSANLIGRELSAFYRRRGDLTTAATFLVIALRQYDDDQWPLLAAHTRLQLASCYRDMPDHEKLTKMCCSIASSKILDMSVRVAHFEEAQSTLKEVKPDPHWITDLGDSFSLVSVGVQVLEEELTVEAALDVVSNFPASVRCVRIALSVELLASSSSSTSSSSQRQKEASVGRPGKAGGGSLQHSNSLRQQSRNDADRCDKHLVKGNREDVRPANPLLTRLQFTERLDVQEDKSLAAANVVCKNSKQCLRRQDSQGRCRKPSTVNRGDFSRSISAENVTLHPGHNNVSLKAKAEEVGYFRLCQLSVLLDDGLEFVSLAISPRLCYHVTGASPSLTIHSHESLVAGPKQAITLIINTASFVLNQKSSIFLRSTTGSTLQRKESDAALERQLEIALPALQPFTTLTFPLVIQAHLPPQKANNSIEHIISVRCPWGEDEKQMPLQFQPPLVSVCRLHTACLQKFLHVSLTGLNSQPLHLSDPRLICLSHPHLKLTSLCPAQHQSVVLSSEQKIGFMWELDPYCFEEKEETPPLKIEFSVSYSTHAQSDQQKQQSTVERNVYKCPFEIVNYKTLFVVESRVEPTKGSEFCRASTLCHLHVHVRRVNACASADTSLMYEVLADQTMWAVCGRTAGVITLESGESDRHSVMLDVMPLINGYLPLPLVRLSKYIPANVKLSNKAMNPDSHPRLEPFSPGQVYNSSKGTQVHVIAAVST